jgi:diacylglycerol kinase family enzyme
MIESIATPPIVFRITIDGRSFTVEASGVFVSNVEDLGLGRPTDISRLSDGHLALNILNPKDFRDYVEIGFRFAGGYVDGNPPHYVRMIEAVLIEVLPLNGRASSLQVSGRKLKAMLTGQPPPSQQRRDIIAMIDGDECGTTPMHVGVVPQAVTVLVPPKKLASASEQPAGQHLPSDAA